MQHARVQIINTDAEERIENPSHNNQCLHTNYTDNNAEERIGDSNSKYQYNSNNNNNAADHIGGNNSQYCYRGNTNNSHGAEHHTGDNDIRYRNGDSNNNRQYSFQQYNNRPGNVGDNYNLHGGYNDSPNNPNQPHSPRNQLHQPPIIG